VSAWAPWLIILIPSTYLSKISSTLEGAAFLSVIWLSLFSRTLYWPSGPGITRFVRVQPRPYRMYACYYRKSLTLSLLAAVGSGILGREQPVQLFLNPVELV
jgi:hypothetical protein